MHVNVLTQPYDEGVSTEVAGPVPRVDRDDARPLHVQIFDILHQQIASHALSPGSALPTEDELQQQFGVSRSVVRQALASLADRGLIHRQRGRGSVVAAAPVLRRSVQRAGGLDEQAVAQGHQLRTHVVSIEPSAPPDEAQAELGTVRAWQIERIRYLDEVPVAYMRTWVSRELFPHFTEELLEGNSLLALMRAHGYTPAGGPRHVQAVAAAPNLAHALEVQTGDPLLLLEGVTRDTSGQGLEWFRVWHRANTVFDVDAQVSTTPAAISPEQVARLRSMARELDAALAQIDGTR